MVAYALLVLNEVSFTYREAFRSSKNEEWKRAMDDEMQSLQKNQTWDLTQLPKNKNTIGCRWIYAKKQGFPRRMMSDSK